MTASQLFARPPLGMLSLAIRLHVHERTGSYATAGVVVARMSVGESAHHAGHRAAHRAPGHGADACSGC